MPDAEFSKLIRDLDQVPKELRRQLGGALRKAAKPIQSDAKRLSSWSTRIPGAISIRTRFATGKTQGVSVRVNAKKAPHARPFENMGQPGTFRHPVFGNRDVWVAQEARPFLFPAAVGKLDEVVREVGNAVEESARLHGWR